MSFLQTKLTKFEWESMEQKVDSKELDILKMIREGYNDENVHHYIQQTASQLLKLEHPDKDYYIYQAMFKDIMTTFVKKYSEYGIKEIKLSKPKKALNTADTIRLDTNSKKIETCIEYTALETMKVLVKNMSKGNNKEEFDLHYYNIQYLVKTYKLNVYIEQYLKAFLEFNQSKTNCFNFLEHTYENIENNTIFNYTPLGLYEHQKQIYRIMKTDGPHLIYYRAPTSSGKTLTPIGLCEHYKVIFICASRHIGLSLAKSAVNIGRKVAFAFGCVTPDDIRLHYSSVKTYIEKYGRKKPVHGDGRNVELMICDIQSYEVAMLYMSSFFPEKDMSIFWDEPTITMDYDDHDLHSDIRGLWSINKIPNIILSSATLPNEEDLKLVSQKYSYKFKGNIHYIETLDETTNITLLDTKGNIIMPHSVFESSYSNMKTFIEKHGKSHMKFLSLNECASFILYLFKNSKNSSLIDHIKNKFKNLDDITSQSIRLCYYELIYLVEPTSWTETIIDFQKTRNKTPMNVGNHIITESSHTLTHGPTIYLCEDTDKWMNFLVEHSGINSSAFDELDKKIEYNNAVSEKLEKTRKLIEDKTSKFEDNENKMREQRFDPETKSLIHTAEVLERSLKQIQLSNLFIPNSREHFTKWAPNGMNYEKSNAFMSRVDEIYVKNIMKLNTDKNYKILLLLGIGIFNPSITDYNDIMKELAEEKKLGVILAGSDYIYGTNYQFCHAYISEDLLKMTQEKIIQAIGRVGRKEKNKTFTFRFRDDSIIQSLFIQTNNIEALNMNKLFM
jgi:hypothetical protein